MKNNHVIDWREVATLLMKTSTLSRREIARQINVPRSTVLDHLRKQS